MLKEGNNYNLRGDMLMKLTFESKGDFDKTLAWLSRVVNRAPTKTLQQIARDGERALSANTPRDTGETASSWVSEITSRNNVSEISWMNTAHPEANVNVAKIIDQGHGTRTGGFVQPRPYIQKAMDDVWKSASDKIAKELIK